MFHLLKLGPVPLSVGTTGVYLRIGETGEPSAPVFEQTDAAGVRALIAGLEPSQVSCEPALADAASELGLAVAPPSPAALSARAAIATFLAWGQLGVSGLGSDKALLVVQAATEFWDAKPWMHWDDSQPFVVEVTGAHAHTYEGCVFHGDDEGPSGLALYLSPGSLGRLLELQVHGAEAEAKALPAITVSLEGRPAYAVEALSAAGRLPRLPLPVKAGPQGLSVPSSLEALILVAALRAVARLTPSQPEALSSMVAGDARMDVRVRAPAPRVRN
ncbi:hypothetical protein [Corallococcus aberystwythensis]|uniref:Uncharacterized protein n=1 Tax=Corallococcus aberystwythensis TaxID=2316722 RepID=A0A3A8PNX4_9BACT|nr:hypothetical protein [Corallococcus aberystwythensis]RKH57839.1 hypothetical protein D7W81_30280 [Corallococcus aberystwythensis]